MKLKEIDRTAMQAWSPTQHHPIYLAAGTSAQQLDATFSTSASLEIFELDLSDVSLDMKSCGTFSSSHRYHKLVWGPHGMDSQDHPSGVLIAGGENGSVILYNPARIVDGDTDVVIAQNDKHTGPVRALDVNPFQTNLVASGGNESEIYIWDLNSFSSPMTPGPKTQPLEDISCVAWNRQVQHILASASPSGRASVWDLRKNDLIIKVSDHSNRMHCSGLAWNPEVATQLVLASEDDRMPVIQVWDLRFATSPLKVLENHTRGVLAIAWSLADPELLLSCGKDNRILCWNPNTAEVLYELPTSTQWCFDIQWCPRNPAVLSAATFDGHISIYSIMGGSSDGQRQKNVDQISTSFGNLDLFGTGQALPPLQLPQTSAPKSTITPLKKPPKWIRRPVGASFAFGGKLVTLENIKPNPQQPQQTNPVVYVSQVVTETDFLQRSNQLQVAMAAGGFAEFCHSKIENAQNKFEKTVWSFLKVNFESDTRGKYLELLGYNKEELAAKIGAALQKGEDELPQSAPAIQAVPDDEAEQESEQPFPDVDDQEEVDLEETKAREAEEVRPEETPVLKLSVTEDVDGLITQALLTGDFEGAVNLCLHDNRMADSIILAIAGGAELLEKTQRKYFSQSPSKITKLISAVVTKDWKEILQTCDLQNWKEALAAVMTYSKPEEFANLCDMLGSRLEASTDTELQTQACLCYICAGNVEKLVSCWSRAQDGFLPLSLQDLVEKVVVLQRAVSQTKDCASLIGTLLAEKMSQYASLLASQGSLVTAAAYLPGNTDQISVQQLRERLHRALGQTVAATPAQVAHNRAPTRQPYTPLQPAVAPASQYYQPQVRPASTITSWSNQTPTALPSIPPPVGRASDSQADPVPPGFVMQPHAVPATLSSATSGHMYSPQYPQTVPQVHQYMPGVSGPTIYQPQHYTPAPPPLSSTSAPYPTQYMHPTPSHPTPAVFPAGHMHPASASVSSPPSLLSSGGSFQHSGPGAPAPYPPPASSGPTGPQNGWNDPPSLNRGPKKKKIPEHYTPPSPITAPIMAPFGDTQAQPLSPLQPQQLTPGHAGIQAPFMGLQQPQVPGPLQPTLPGMNVEGAPGAPIGDVAQPMQSIPAEKIAKKPIPEEHLILKTTFEGLIQKCLAAASDPQTKRKLDDANKRLEFLYDKLREQTLSPAIVGGLHNLAHSIESRSYIDSLNIHTHIVSNSNFSETSAFMPVLKVVLTQANKLGV